MKSQLFVGRYRRLPRHTANIVGRQTKKHCNAMLFRRKFCGFSAAATNEPSMSADNVGLCVAGLSSYS